MSVGQTLEDLPCCAAVVSGCKTDLVEAQLEGIRGPHQCQYLG